MALKEPYVTVEEADVYLADSETWAAATTAQKENALFWGRTYLDTYYRCPYLDEDNPSDEIKLANSLLGEDYLQGTILNSDGSRAPLIRMERVKAGSVESETEYAAGYQANPQQDVDSLLSEQCSKKGLTANLVRA